MWSERLDVLAGEYGSVLREIDAFFARQRASWPLLRDNELLLSTVQQRRIGPIVAQLNPGRRASVNADIHPSAVAARPCFLCEHNLPAQQRALAWQDGLVILCNPYPALARHLCICSREHEPQRLAGREEQLFYLARALGEDMFVFYNGPASGASAPDHFHFQAASNELLLKFPTSRFARIDGRAVVMCDSPEQLSLAMAAWASLRASPQEPEPPVNVLCSARQGRPRAALFPRARHRPSRYFASEADRIAVSPASLEMAGILILAEAEHLERLDQRSVTQIYTEVCIDDHDFSRLQELLQ